MTTTRRQEKKRHLGRRRKNWRRNKKGSLEKGSKLIRKRWDRASSTQHSNNIQDNSPPAGERRSRIPLELHRAACNPKTPSILPSRLRPLKPRKRVPTLPPRRLTGNIVADVTKCEENFNICFRRHLEMSPNCKGDVVLDPQSFNKWGLAFAGRMKCTHDCGFKSSELKFYKEVKRRGRGRKAARINTQLQVVLTKHPIGNAAMRDILSCTDTVTPCESSMQKTANKVCDAFHDITKNQLKANRQKVSDAMVLRKGAMKNGVPQIVAQTDVAYNNPIKGRSFYQPATTAFAPCFAGEPGLENVPTAFATRSKVCSCRTKNGVKVHKPDCRLNYPPNKAIGNAEVELGKDLAAQIVDGDAPLGIRTLVTDGDSHLQQGMNEIMNKHGFVVEKGDCTRHVTRSISRNIRKANLSRKCTGLNNTAVERGKNQSRLANFVERRCAWEFRAIHNKFGGDLETMVKRGEMAIVEVMGCIQGFEDVCHDSSLVCGAHRGRTGLRPPEGLPGGKYVQLTKADRLVIERWCRNKLGEVAIRGQKDNLTTNRSEASHLTVFKGNPKCRNRLRNHHGRAMSAVHSMSLGVIDSVETANRYLGADNIEDCPANSTRSKLREREEYQKRYRTSLASRKNRYAAKCRARRIRCSQPITPWKPSIPDKPRISDYGYSTGVQLPIVRHDHAYNR